MELRERIARANVAREDEDKRDVFAEVKDRVHAALIADLGPQLFNAEVDGQALRSRITVEIRERVAQERGLSHADRERLVDEILDDTLGHGPLERMLADDSVTEIMVNGPHDVWIERRGKLYQTTVKFTDEAHLRRIINKIVSQIGRRIDESSPMVDARLPDGSRVNAIIPPLSLSGPLLTIRKFAKYKMDLDDLVKVGTLSERRGRVRRRVHARRAEHPGLGRHGQRQDDAPERDVDADPGRAPHRHDRGCGRAAPQPAPRAAAGVAPAQHRGRGRGADPRAGPQLAAHAAGPDHRRRGPRRRGAGHAAGDEHGPRRLAVDGARELRPRRAGPHRDDGADGRLRPADARDPPAGRLGAGSHHPSRAHDRRLAQGHGDHRGRSTWRATSSRRRTSSCTASRT